MMNICNSSTTDCSTTTTTTSTTSTPKSSTKKLEEIPVELLKRIAGFLAYQDAFNFVQVDKQLCKALNMSTIRLPTPLLSGTVSWSGHFHTGDRPYPCSALPILCNRHRVHTVLVKGLWNDQGWGNRKGEMYIIGTTSTTTTPGEDGITTTTNSSRLVTRSLISAPHDQGQLQLQFHNSRDDEQYQLWYSVGSGGGHSLSISDWSMEMFFYGNDDDEGIPVLRTDVEQRRHDVNVLQRQGGGNETLPSHAEGDVIRQQVFGIPAG